MCYLYPQIRSFILIPSLNLTVNVFFSSTNGIRKYQRMRVVDRTGSFETNRIMGPSREIRHLPGGVKNEMSHSTDEGGEYYGSEYEARIILYAKILHFRKLTSREPRISK